LLPSSVELATALTVAALVAVFALDSWTGEAPVQHLYYLPILYAAVRFGARGGLLASTAAIVLYHLPKPNLWRLGHTEADVLLIILFSAFGPVVGRTHGRRGGGPHARSHDRAVPAGRRRGLTGPSGCASAFSWRHPISPARPFRLGRCRISIGIVSWQSTLDDLAADAALTERLFKEADAALYAAKRLGRNRVHIGRSWRTGDRSCCLNGQNGRVPPTSG